MTEHSRSTVNFFEVERFKTGDQIGKQFFYINGNVVLARTAECKLTACLTQTQMFGCSQ